jgi:prevent-host-death family protein
MKTMTASDARRRFGQLLKMAQSEPVCIRKQGRDVAVVLSLDEFDCLAAAARPDVKDVERLHRESVRRYSRLYQALAK